MVVLQVVLWSTIFSTRYISSLPSGSSDHNVGCGVLAKVGSVETVGAQVVHGSPSIVGLKSFGDLVWSSVLYLAWGLVQSFPSAIGGEPLCLD